MSSLPHLSALRPRERDLLRKSAMAHQDPQDQTSPNVQRTAHCVGSPAPFSLPNKTARGTLVGPRLDRALVAWEGFEIYRRRILVAGGHQAVQACQGIWHTKKGLVSRSQGRIALMRLEFVVGQSRWGANQVAAGEGTIKRPWVGLALTIGDDPLQRLPSFGQSLPLSRLETGILSSSPP